jgi:hypothetical protein
MLSETYLFSLIGLFSVAVAAQNTSFESVIVLQTIIESKWKEINASTISDAYLFSLVIIRKCLSWLQNKPIVWKKMSEFNYFSSQCEKNKYIQWLKYGTRRQKPLKSQYTFMGVKITAYVPVSVRFTIHHHQYKSTNEKRNSILVSYMNDLHW